MRCSTAWVPARGHIKGGRIKVIAVASDKRAPGFPNIPTAAESGLNYKVSTGTALGAERHATGCDCAKMQVELKRRTTR